jgi:hypothetical protein
MAALSVVRSSRSSTTRSSSLSSPPQRPWKRLRRRPRRATPSGEPPTALQRPCQPTTRSLPARPGPSAANSASRTQHPPDNPPLQRSVSQPVAVAVGLPDETFRPDPDGVPVFRTRELRSGWVPSLPRGRRCSSRPSSLLDRRLPLFGGQSLHPAPTSHRTGLRLTRHQRGFKQFTRPTVPLACGRPDGTGRPWAFPRASHPADQEPTTHAEVGTGHRSTDLELLAQHLHLVDPPIGSSLTTCDLASHDEQRQPATPVDGRLHP